ncbi:MAG: ribosome-associated translation inhibitor RaiA [Tenuifilum sp.]|uniref:ribosome hibernation-promoting factor, HPF/YfiA family n=1 Tax=Tenuifilum TaxID=2760873 RepID=UPI001B4E40BA|nr:ribosome-associated translation inhibitor RaiA [Bacteroidales bacterium]HOK60895.1 ribosome-associated translation inhibitor RaiA [Tenuifilum sp.]MBP9029341.1 ribosome-associated translation inhibitor RaiA [Bacteroidales bacterium]HOK86665.1 ribosome-associated translation inhibitor RaiA [Tenuifilum sp.]HON70950.1 ribosome-associated translation inhibitor RaiA [Tenuifilum sp.]
MNVKIQSIKFDADRKLLDYVEKKAAKLERYFDNIVETEVYLKLENSQDMENKVVEFRLKVPGNDLFAQRKGKTFEEATDLCIDVLKGQVKKFKEKLRGV